MDGVTSRHGFPCWQQLRTVVLNHMTQNPSSEDLGTLPYAAAMLRALEYTKYPLCAGLSLGG